MSHTGESLELRTLLLLELLLLVLLFLFLWDVAPCPVGQGSSGKRRPARNQATSWLRGNCPGHGSLGRPEASFSTCFPRSNLWLVFWRAFSSQNFHVQQDTAPRPIGIRIAIIMVAALGAVVNCDFNYRFFLAGLKHFQKD